MTIQCSYHWFWVKEQVCVEVGEVFKISHKLLLAEREELGYVKSEREEFAEAC